MDTQYWKEHPYVSVGIMESTEINFVLNGVFAVNGQHITGVQQATLSEDKIAWNGQEAMEFIFTPLTASCSFTLSDVVIGIHFHWERKEQQTFPGCLKLVVGKNSIIAVNIVHIEDYLLSVISSEMKASASLEFLKAAAVISRSWLLKQIENRQRRNTMTTEGRIDTAEELASWNDRADHTLFDVCADDHCQRYQGIQKATSTTVRQAIAETRGMILTSGDEICDARFYKCCGGMTEEYPTCWENLRFSYLSCVRDSTPGPEKFPDLTTETEADHWIRSNPSAFCNTQDKNILQQVLNDYDMETMDFYRWKQEYSQQELRALITEGTGKDLGDIIDLQPLERGKSGRIYRLRIVGSRQSFIIGKELVIRRVLSTSHLYSSAFIVDREDVRNGVPQRFILHGAGWGHGVGLCQIGAAVMGSKGYSYDKILQHYYQGAIIEKIY